MGSGNLDHSKVYVEVWGDFAIFTSPVFKVERYSYDVLTPSAARNILQQIYWHPQLQYEINRITVFNEIQRMGITRNEIALGRISANKAFKAMECAENFQLSPSLSIPSDAIRQQRSASFLSNVHYGIEATIHPDKNCSAKDYEPEKWYNIFTRRRDAGQCYVEPFLGAKECIAHFGEYRYSPSHKSFYQGKTEDLGIMLYDCDYRVPKCVEPIFYHPIMVNGTIKLRPQSEIMGKAAFHRELTDKERGAR